MNYTYYEIAVREKDADGCFSTIETYVSLDEDNDIISMTRKAFAIAQQNKSEDLLISLIGINDRNEEFPIVDYFWNAEDECVEWEEF